MFGIHLPSVSDVTHAVTGAASSALHTTEDLGSSAVSHATSLGRSGLDLGRSAINTVSHIDVQKLGSTATSAIGKAETYAEHGIQTGVMKAGQGVHIAADYGRSHITGSDPLSRLARGAITVTEDQTRFDLGVVGGVSKAAVGLVGSVGQLGVLAAEYQASPSARAAIDAKISGAVVGGAKSLAGYADSVAHNPSRVVGDATHVATAATGWAKGQAKSAEQAIKDGHGPESFGMQVGNAATYLIPVGGEARIAAEGGELATRGVVGALGEDGARVAAEDAPKTLARGGADAGASGADRAGADAGTKAAGGASADGARAALDHAGSLLDRAAAGTTSVADARAALLTLTPADRFAALKNFVARMDVSTPKNTATFWSGGLPTAGGFASSRGPAEAVAKAEGRYTLESTSGGRVLDQLKITEKTAPLADDAQSAQLWDGASARYAEAATGKVVAVVENARPTSTWNRVEQPILEQSVKSGRVTEIEIRSPASPGKP